MSDLNDTLIPVSEESGKQPLMDLINEMQDAVTEMKQAFVVALDQLKTASDEDASLRRAVESNKAEAQEQAAQVLRLVLSFKSEFAWVRSALEAAQEQSAALSRAIQRMEGDRDALLSELVSCGAISQHARDRLHSPSTNLHYHCDVRPENSSSSGAPSSSDSGVAHLLERAHAAFSIPPHPPPLYPDGMRQKSPKTPSLDGKHWQGPGGGGEQQGQDSAMVRDYVAGLTSAAQGSPEGGAGEGQWEEEEMRRRQEAFAVDAGNISSPDSDSSLSRAITKSLGLSTSLGRQCGLELDQTASGLTSAGLEHKQAGNTAAGKGNNRKQSLKSMHSHSDSDTESSRLPKHSLGDRTDGVTTMRCSQNDRSKKDIFVGSRKSCDETMIGISPEDLDVERRRRSLILELIDTERCYCDTLRTLRQTFAEPLSVQDILSPKDVDTLFPREVEALHQQHTSLLAMLEELVNKGMHAGQRTLGDILRHFIELEGLGALHLYTSYVDNFPDALQTFHKLCRCSPEFTNFLKDCLKSPDCGGLDLGGFLLTPVQRLPRLVLILRRLLAITPQHHPDWAPLSFTINRLAVFLSRLNDSMEHSFQLVAAQLSTPPETEEDFGHLDNFDDVCGESTANEECLETLNDLTSDGETATEVNDVINIKPATLESVETEVIDHGVRRRLGQRVVSSEWEKSRNVGAVGDVSVHSRTSSPNCAPVQVSPEPEKSLDESRHSQNYYHTEETPTKKTGCHCVRRCRETRCAKKYSKLCSVKGREGRSSQDLANLEPHVESAPLRSTTSEWAMMGRHDGEHSRKRHSRCERPAVGRHRDSCASSSPSCCIHDCSSGCMSTVERRRGTSLPRRGHGVEVRRRTHSTGRTSREHDTSSDDDLSGGPKLCYHSECKAQGVTSPSKGKAKRRWFKTSKSMHDFQNEVSDVLGAEGKGIDGGGQAVRMRRRSSDDRDGKMSVARSVDNLSVDGSLSSSKDRAGDEGIKASVGMTAQGERQVMYTARMLRCSSLEVATLGKVNDVVQGSAGTGGAAKEDSGSGGKKGKTKKLSLRASIKNMLSFKRRYVRDGEPREAVSHENKKEGSCPLPPTIAFGYPYKIDENFHSLITQLNRMPTYIQLVIFCLKETTV